MIRLWTPKRQRVRYRILRWLLQVIKKAENKAWIRENDRSFRELIERTE